MRFGQCAAVPPSIPTVVNRAACVRACVVVVVHVGVRAPRVRVAVFVYHRPPRTNEPTCCGRTVPVPTMKKHSKQLEKRIEDQLLLERQLPDAALSTADRRRSSKCKNGILKNESSPELSRPPSRKSRQYFLEPIRRWNSFHNSRERKTNAAAAGSVAAPISSTSSSTSSASNLPYLQTLVNFQRESKSVCARFAQSVLPKMPRGADSAPVLGTAAAGEMAAAAVVASSSSSSSSPVHYQTAAGSPAKKQNSSPNLLLVYDRRQQGTAGRTGCGGGGGNSLMNSPRRSARRPKTPPPLHHHHHHHQQQQQQQQEQQQQPTMANSSSCGGTDASKIPFAIIVGDSPIVCKDTVPRIKAIRADSVSEKSSSSYLAVDLSPHRRYSFWSVNLRVRFI